MIYDDIMKIWRKRLTQSMNYLINYEAVYSSAPDTPGLLKSDGKSIHHPSNFPILPLSSNLFIYQVRVKPGPSRVSDSPVFVENVIYETFIVMTKLRWNFSALISWGEKKMEVCPFYKISIFYTHSLSSRKAME